MPDPENELEEWAPGNYGAGSEAWSGQPRRSDADRPGVAAGGVEPGVPTHAGGFNAYVELQRQWIERLRELQRMTFGNGADGDRTVSSNADLATGQDVYYDDLTINAGVRLRTYGRRVFVLGTLTIGLGGSLDADGSDAPATGPTSSGGWSSSAVAGSEPGGDGGNASGANNGADGDDPATASLGGDGGDGGDGSPTGGTGGQGGNAVVPNAAQGGTRVLSSLQQALVARYLDGTLVAGGGGGGGGGSGNQASAHGAPGGDGGGVVVVVANRIVLNGRISANGGAGGTGRNGAARNGGGGGGGGGGVAIIVTARAIEYGAFGTVEAVGGAGGPGGTFHSGTVYDGEDGADGTVVILDGGA